MARRPAQSTRSRASSTRSRRKSNGKSNGRSVRRGESLAGIVQARGAARSTGRVSRRLAREDRSVSRGQQSRWSAQDDRELKDLVRRRTPAAQIGERLGRTTSAVRQHVHKLGLSFRTAGRRI